jgi:hypothetical protein
MPQHRLEEATTVTRQLTISNKQHGLAKGDPRTENGDIDPSSSQLQYRMRGIEGTLTLEA